MIIIVVIIIIIIMIIVIIVIQIISSGLTADGLLQVGVHEVADDVDVLVVRGDENSHGNECYMSGWSLES